MANPEFSVTMLILGQMSQTVPLGKSSLGGSTLNNLLMGRETARVGIQLIRIQMATADVSQHGGADIWVASGTYTGRVDCTSSAHLYGGFAGNEETETQRSWSRNKTIIDLGSSCIFLLAASSIDGFQIKHGYEGVYCFLRQTAIRNCTITDCYIAIINFVDECTVANNVIDQNRGGISCGNVRDTRITGNVLSRNTYGLALSDAVVTLRNNTIVSNRTGISCSRGVTTLVNNIVALNEVGIDSRFGASYVSRNNDVFGNTLLDTPFAPGPDDISSNPHFTDLANGDFHLKGISPCIDAGTNDGAPTIDFDGIIRPVDGDCDGVPTTDMGAFEYVPIHVTIDVLPGQSPNHIVQQPNKLILVAILGSASFDVGQVDALSVVFGPGRTAEVHGKGHVGDVNFDGFTDMVLHFRCGETGITQEIRPFTSTGE